MERNTQKALFNSSDAVDSEAIDQYFAVTEYAQEQYAEQRNEELLGLVAFTGGAASVPALIHYGGVVSQVSLHSMQRAGTATQLKLWGSSNAARHEGVRLTMLGTEAVYGTGTAATYYTTFTGGAGFATGLTGGVPGTPPAYTSDGVSHPALIPWQTGEAVGSAIHDGLRFFPERTSER